MTEKQTNSFLSVFFSVSLWLIFCFSFFFSFCLLHSQLQFDFTAGKGDITKKEIIQLLLLLLLRGRARCFCLSVCLSAFCY